MALAGIELRYLVSHITERAAGYYVSNIYGIDRNSVLFKLHHTEKEDLFMMVSTSGVWLTGVRAEQAEPNRLLKRMRGDLRRLRLARIEQKGAERIAYFVFEGFGKRLVMVAEFFGDGNILVCDEQMKILALQHSIEVRHRKLGVGLVYSPPPEGGIDVLDATERDFEALGSSDLAAGKWLGRNMGLPKKYVEGIFAAAGVDPGISGNSLDAGQVAGVCSETLRIVRDVVSGNHDAVIADGDALPVRLAGGDAVPSFMEGLDRVFTEAILARGREIRSGGSKKAVEELETRLGEQRRAIQTVKSKSDSISRVANSLYEMAARGITSIRDAAAQEILSANGASLITEKGAPLMQVEDEKIKINPDSPLQSVASALFDAAKRQSRATASIEAAIASTEKKLEEARGRTEAEMRLGEAARIRKKAWYERYRWFHTSDGMLAIGGRDAPSNSAVVRKHMEDGDLVFHADIFGSPFFILKDARDAPESSVAEVAHATVCFSRAWREGMYGVSAYWVRPGQVKKSAPSGEFLPKGSFTVEGQRNFVRTETLRLAVGLGRRGDDHILTCGPPDAIRRGSVCYAIIEPHGSEMAEAAKRIRTELSRLDAAAGEIPVDDFVRVLPAGRSQIKEAGPGGA